LTIPGPRWVALVCPQTGKTAFSSFPDGYPGKPRFPGKPGLEGPRAPPNPARAPLAPEPVSSVPDLDSELSKVDFPGPGNRGFRVPETTVSRVRKVASLEVPGTSKIAIFEVPGTPNSRFPTRKPPSRGSGKSIK